MKPAPFTLHRPDTLAAVLELLAEHDTEARLIAGGQSLMPMMNLRLVSFSHLIDLNRVSGLADVRLDDDLVRIGAMTRQQELLHHPLIARHAPLLAAALPYIGHIQTRSRGTVGGSLAHADPSAELPLTMVTLDARLTIASPRGQREVAARAFFVDVLSTDLAPDEVLTEIAIPAAPAGTRVCFREYSRRHGDFAIAAGAAQYIDGPDGGRLAVGLGGVNPVPFYCEQLSRSMSARRGLQELDRFIEDELQKLDPISDPQADQNYRKTLAAVLLSDCVREVLQ